MNKYLPSKKFALTILSVVIVVGLIYFFTAFKKTEVTTPEQLAAETKAQEFMILDTDGDNLKDWEEILWKTDPKKMDTDGDGTNDGDETKASRDPLKANTTPSGKEPNDKIDATITATEEKKVEEFNKLSETEKFSRQLFSEYMVAKNDSEGGTLDTASKESIVNNAIVKTTGTIITKFTVLDINRTNNTSTSSLKDYGNTLGNITIKYSTDGLGDELVYIQEALGKQDPKLLAKLNPIIANYDNIVTAFLGTPVPRDLTEVHIKMVNNLYNVKISLENIKLFFTDPLKGIANLETYQISFKDLFVNIETLRRIALEKGVVFDGSDPGYVFVNISQP